MFGLRAPHGIQVQLGHQPCGHAVSEPETGVFQQSLECCPGARDRTVTGAPFREVHKQRADTAPVFPALTMSASLPAQRLKSSRHWAGSRGRMPGNAASSSETVSVGTDKTDKNGPGNGFVGFVSSCFGDSRNFEGGFQFLQRLLASMSPPDSRIEIIGFAGPSGTLVTPSGFLPNPAVPLEH